MDNGAIAPLWQPPFFIEYVKRVGCLTAGGLFSRCITRARMRRPGAISLNCYVVGFAARRRYAHIATLRATR
jgi:hypothetical protein